MQDLRKQICEHYISVTSLPETWADSDFFKGLPADVLEFISSGLAKVKFLFLGAVRSRRAWRGSDLGSQLAGMG